MNEIKDEYVIVAPDGEFLSTKPDLFTCDLSRAQRFHSREYAMGMIRFHVALQHRSEFKVVTLAGQMIVLSNPKWKRRLV